MHQQLLKLELTGFRTYETLSVPLEAEAVFFIGQNGAGKTSILEAIGVASVLRSFRGGNDRDMIRFGNPFYSVTVDYSSAGKNSRQHVAFGRDPSLTQQKDARRMSLNGEKINRSSEFIGRLQTVFFSPDDIAIVDSGPAERRRFFDILLSSLFPGYYENLQNYQRTLKLRSALFKSNSKPDNVYLSSLDKELAKAGNVILGRRISFIKKFEPAFQKYVALISGSRDQWRIVYRPTILAQDERNYFQELEKNRSKDLRLRQTTCGIHRDQIAFLPEPAGSFEEQNPDLSRIASQGQKRTAALALKMAQYELTREVRGERPVLLIDDVLNELDSTRRKHFIHFLHEIGQALITTTDVDSIAAYLAERKDIRTLIYKIEDNHITLTNP